jgi:RNA recognition motif-containing protein
VTGKRLYIGNLPYSATDQSLRDTFSRCGTVESADVIIDRETGKAKGFAFVEMSTPEEALAAIKRFDGTDYEGRAMKVNEAKPARAVTEFGPRSS